MTQRRELHMVYGVTSQGWEETALGWVQVDHDNWANGSYTVVIWPHIIPEPVKNGPPREVW